MGVGVTLVVMAAAVVLVTLVAVVLAPKYSPVSACTAIALVDSAGSSLVFTFEPSAS